jgi:hypothetical protein
VRDIFGLFGVTHRPGDQGRFSVLCRFYDLCHFSVPDHSAFLELTGRKRIAFFRRLTSYLLYPLKVVDLNFSDACRFLTLYFLLHAEHRPIFSKDDF